MISNTNESKQPREFIDIPRYLGVASVKVVAVNPNNAKLRELGWQIPQEADEPQYTFEKTLDDGTVRKSTKIRFMVQLTELPDTPIIPLDFWIRPTVMLNRDGSKCCVIDNYGRTAWATQEEVKAGRIPMYSNGEASISTPYRPCHFGEDKIIRFLWKYLCITPFEAYDSRQGKYVKNPNPGTLTIDNWKKLAGGDTTELKQYVNMKPNNQVKVILGVSKTEDNRTYQAFVEDIYLGNGSTPDRRTNIYNSAQKAIDTVIADGRHDNYQFSASPVKEYTVTPTKVVQSSPAVSSTATTAMDVETVFTQNENPFDNGEVPEDLPF